MSAVSVMRPKPPFGVRCCLEVDSVWTTNPIGCSVRGWMIFMGHAWYDICHGARHIRGGCRRPGDGGSKPTGRADWLRRL